VPFLALGIDIAFIVQHVHAHVELAWHNLLVVEDNR
jgi:hypothetical protein